MIASHPSDDLASAVWIDLVAPTEEEIARVRAATGLRIPDQNAISEIESSSRLAFESGAYYVSTPLVAPQIDGDLLPTSVGFVLSARVLLTVRFGPLPSFDAAHQACRAQQTRTAEESFLSILEIVVDRSADGLEQAGAECDDLSRSAFRGSRDPFPPKSGGKGRGKGGRPRIPLGHLGLAWGYPMALGLIVVSALLPLLWFKRRGWM